MLGSVRGLIAVGGVVVDDLAARGAERVERHRWGYWDGLLRYLELDGALPETAGIPVVVAVDVAGSVELVVGGSACGLDYGLGTFADLEMHSAFAAGVVALVLVADIVVAVAVAVVDAALFPFAAGTKVEVADHSDADWQLRCGS